MTRSPDARRRSVFFALTLAGLGPVWCGCAARPEAADAPTPVPAASVVDMPASDPRLEPFGNLTGAWRAELDAAVFEESWLAPAGGNMTGVLRSVRSDGSAGLFELMTLTAEPAGVTMRLRHFGSALNPWASESDGPIVAVAEPSVGPGNAAAVFVVRAQAGREPSVRSIGYDWSVPDRLTVTLDFAGGREPVVIGFTRAER